MIARHNGLLLRALLLCVAPLATAFPAAVASEESQRTNPLRTVERTIDKEPRYADAPRYAMLVFGPEARSKVWVVEDGRTLYVDRNGNSDLTDDGPPLRPSDVRDLGRSQYEFHYAVDAITTPAGSRHTDFRLSRWRYADGEDGYGLTLKVDGLTEVYVGWTDFWSPSPERAPLIHLGGPLRPVLLRQRAFTPGSEPGRLSIALANPGHVSGAASRLSIDAVAPEVMPEVRIDWPVAQGRPPLRTSHRLTARCCYWEFYQARFSVPEGVAEGTARLRVVFPFGAVPLELADETIEVPVNLRNARNAEDGSTG